MAGVMFNGIELQKGEDINTYINKVVNSAISKVDNTRKCYKCDHKSIDNALYIVDAKCQRIYICIDCFYKSRLVKCIICDDTYIADKATEHADTAEHKKAYINWCGIVNTIARMDTDTDSSSDEELKPQSIDTTDTSMDDTETEAEKVYTTLNKRLILTTEADMDTHDNIILTFNHIYDTSERGANGSPSQYFTHGETVYDLNKLPRLKGLYTTEIKNMKIDNVNVHIRFIDVDPENEYRTIPQQTINYITGKAKKYITNNKHLLIKDPRVFQTVIEHPDIKTKMCRRNKTNKIKVNNTIIQYNDKFYKVVKTYKDPDKVKGRLLTPHLTIAHKCIDHDENDTNETNIYKVMKDDTYGKDKTIKNVTNMTKYNIDDYLLYIKVIDYV